MSQQIPTTQAIKSDHLRLTFPTYGAPGDNPDPLTYLSKCHDFFALHQLSDAEIPTTLRTVLQGTARNWWEITRLSVTTWSQFEKTFLSAFLSEKYEEKLAE